MPQNTTINPREIDQFEQLAENWWDQNGEFKPLHRLNPVRLAFIRRHILDHWGGDAQSITPFKNLKIVDIGCGGGLLTEPMARLGAKVTGIDAGAKNIKTAQFHAQKMGLNITYKATTAEDLAKTNARFDVVLAMEIIEHVANPGFFIESCAKLLKPGGLIFLSTLNRTPKSFALGIVAAEYILRMVPRGTHQWRKFVRPSEMASLLEPHNIDLKEIKGVTFNPATGSWRESPDMAVNYMLCAIKS